MENIKKSRVKFPISLKIGALLLPLFVVSLSGLGVFSYITFKDILEDRILSDMAALVESRKDHIEKLIEQDRKRAGYIASAVRLREVLRDIQSDGGDTGENRATLNDMLADMCDVSLYVEEIEVVDMKGKVIASATGKGIGEDVSKNEFFLKGKEGIYLGRIYAAKSSLMHSIAAAVQDPVDDKRTIGVVKTDIELTGLVDVLTDYTGLGHTGEMVITEKINNDILVVGLLRHKEVCSLAMELPADPEFLSDARSSAVLKSKGLIKGKDYRGEDVLAAVHEIPGTDWELVAKIDEKEVFEPIRRIRGHMVIFMAVTLLVIIIVLFIIDRFISYPIEELATGTRVLASGDLDYRVNISGNDEIGQLAFLFNRMVEELKKITVSRDELTKEVAERKKIEKAKEELVHIVAHELRTPLTVVREGAQVVLAGKAGEVNEGQKKLLDMVENNAEMMVRIVNEILDLAKFEAGKVNIKKEDVDLGKIVDYVFSIFDIEARKKGLALVKDMPGERVFIRGDNDAVIRVFANLISNAMKCTKEGGITVSAREKGDEVECAVADTGIGIKKEDLPKLFQKFYQSDVAPLPGSPQGVGLGLSIVRSIVEGHDGRVWVESELGKGTKVSFTLPTANDRCHRS